MRHLVSLTLCAIVLLASSGCIGIVKVKGPIETGRRQAVVVDGKVYVLDLEDHTCYQVDPTAPNDPTVVRLEAAKIEIEIED